MQLEDGTYQNVGRTEIAIAENTELKFVAIFPLANQMNGVRNMTVNTLTGGLALVWNYIESPDGQFYYPLFSTAEQANFPQMNNMVQQLLALVHLMSIFSLMSNHQ